MTKKIFFCTIILSTLTIYYLRSPSLSSSLQGIHAMANSFTDSALYKTFVRKAVAKQMKKTFWWLHVVTKTNYFQSNIHSTTNTACTKYTVG